MRVCCEGGVGEGEGGMGEGRGEEWGREGGVGEGGRGGGGREGWGREEWGRKGGELIRELGHGRKFMENVYNPSPSKSYDIIMATPLMTS